MRTGLPIGDGETFVIMLEPAATDGNAEIIGANLPRLRALVAQLQERATEIALLANRERLLIEQHEPTADERERE